MSEPTPPLALRTDSQTLGDLEILEGVGGNRSLAEHMDRCQTRAGRRRLRERLAMPSSDPATLRAWLDALDWLEAVGASLPLVPGAACDRLARYPDHPLTTTGDRRLRTGRLEAFWISVRDPELLDLAREGRNALGEILAAVLPTARRLVAPGGTRGPGGAAGPTGTGEEVPGPHHPAPSALRVLGESLLGLDEKLGLSQRLGEAGSIMGLLELDDLLRRKHRGDLFRFLHLVAEFDLYRGASELLREGWAVPRLVGPASDTGGGVPGRHLAVDGAWHPELAEGVRHRWALEDGHPVHLVTGPNMAGKTTALRTLGLATWLAHCGLPVPAESMAFRPLGAFHVSLHPRDNLHQGTSLFLAEVLGVRRFLESASTGAPTLGIFDELFRGTNPTDAQEATARVVRALASSRSGALVLSTHLTELAVQLGDQPGIRPLCLAADLDGGRFSFDFQLREGVSAQRLGLALLTHHGLDALLETLP